MPCAFGSSRWRADLTASNAIEPGVLAEIKAGESGRA